MRVWFLTNGYGEDHAAALIAAELVARGRGIQAIGAPLVTPGGEFAARGLPLATTGAPPPSGGFPAAGLGTLLRDLPFVGSCMGYVRQLRRFAHDDDEFVAAGDVFLTGLARLAFGRAGVHLALAKSVYGQAHSRLERVLLRSWARLVFARDQATADALHSRGVRAVFDGNALVDGLGRGAGKLGQARQAGKNCDRGRLDPCQILLLPGSRREAPANLVKLLAVAERVHEPAIWRCAWPAAVPLDTAVRAAANAGWDPVGGDLICGGRSVTLLGGRFDAWLANADLVIGLAGTANEQAAALGKPVVSFIGCGPQTTAARMVEQERLLGGAAQFVRGTAADVADLVVRLLASPAERRRRGALGIARLGPQGAAGRIADRLIEELAL